MTLIWLKYPITWHSSRASAYKKTLTKAENQLITQKWLFWYSADWDYAQPTVIFFCVAIACVSLLYGVFLLRNRSTSRKRMSIMDRVTAAFRYTTARQYRIRLFHWYSPPLAGIIGVAGILIFVFALMLGPHPYLWPNHAMGHSPPIATRTGWISIGILPFMIAFATKVNWVSVLTGTSHEKLQIFHRWSALAMYITSLVHTFVFIVLDIQLHEMEFQWNTTNWYITGVAALVPQTYLVLLSWGIFRDRYYETFKKFHFAAAALFMVFLFIHCCYRLTSWDYLAATAAIWFSTFLIRIFRSLYNGVALPATLELLPDGKTVKLTVQTPPRVKWAPGQHAFVRFLNSGIHVFSSHPFTVSSLSEDGKMEFIFNVHKGVTRRLASMADGKGTVFTRVIVDGPYGGLPGSLDSFDHVHLLAGGTGASFTLPLLHSLVKKGSTANIEFLLAVKNKDSAKWFEENLADKKLPNLKRTIHVTRLVDPSGLPQITKDGSDGPSEDSSLSEEKKNSTPSGTETAVVAGRPDLAAIIREAHQKERGRVAIVACGPASFLYDVRNTVADCQLALADGRGECTDLYLHTETYSW